jgi:hypothetical protein
MPEFFVILAKIAGVRSGEVLESIACGVPAE